MDREQLEKNYLEMRSYLVEVEKLLSKILQKGEGIPFVEKNIRAIKGIIYAFKNGLIESDVD